MNPNSKYNPAIHHRRSIRLKGSDYSRAGLYFITICLHHRKCLFGEIEKDEMRLNDSGRMIEKWYAELENKFPDIHCDAQVVMPNHFHCIIENTGPVRANLCVRPDNVRSDNVRPDADPSNPGEPVLDESNINTPGENNAYDLDKPGGDKSGEPSGITLGEHIGSPLHRVVQWFKTMTTNEYIRNVKNNRWPPFDGKLWQRNYYEHIIRNEKSYYAIVNYILANPSKWHSDRLQPSQSKK